MTTEGWASSTYMSRNKLFNRTEHNLSGFVEAHRSALTWHGFFDTVRRLKKSIPRRHIPLCYALDRKMACLSATIIRVLHMDEMVMALRIA